MSECLVKEYVAQCPVPSAMSESLYLNACDLRDVASLRLITELDKQRLRDAVSIIKDVINE